MTLFLEVSQHDQSKGELGPSLDMYSWLWRYSQTHTSRHGCQCEAWIEFLRDCHWGFPKNSQKVPRSARLSKTGTHVFVLKMFVVDMFAQQAFILMAQPWKVSWHVRRRQMRAWISCIMYERLYECCFLFSGHWNNELALTCRGTHNRKVFVLHFKTHFSTEHVGILWHFYIAAPTALISFIIFAMLFSSTTLFYAIKFDSRTQSPVLRKRRRTPEKFDVAVGSH